MYRHFAFAQDVDHKHDDLQPQQPGERGPAGPVDDQRGDHKRHRSNNRERPHAEGTRQIRRVTAQPCGGHRRDRIAQHQRGRDHADQLLPGGERQRPEDGQTEGQPQRRTRNAGLFINVGKGFKKGSGFRPTVDNARRGVHVNIAGAARGDDRVANHHKGQPAHTESDSDIAIRQRELFTHFRPAAA